MPSETERIEKAKNNSGVCYENDDDDYRELMLKLQINIKHMTQEMLQFNYIAPCNGVKIRLVIGEECSW